jgi:hypothetical protein
MEWPHTPELIVDDQQLATFLVPRSETPKEGPKPFTKTCTGDPKTKEEGEEAEDPEEGIKPKQDLSKGR